MIVQQLHPSNVRATTPTPTQTVIFRAVSVCNAFQDPSVQEQEGLFHELYDVVYTYGLENGVVARTNIDKERDIVPP